MLKTQQGLRVKCEFNQEMWEENKNRKKKTNKRRDSFQSKTIKKVKQQQN